MPDLASTDVLSEHMLDGWKNGSYSRGRTVTLVDEGYAEELKKLEAMQAEADAIRASAEVPIEEEEFPELTDKQVEKNETIKPGELPLIVPQEPPGEVVSVRAGGGVPGPSKSWGFIREDINEFRKGELMALYVFEQQTNKQLRLRCYNQRREIRRLNAALNEYHRTNQSRVLDQSVLLEYCKEYLGLNENLRQANEELAQQNSSLQDRIKELENMMLPPELGDEPAPVEIIQVDA